ncbi:hypothetical protein B0H65DRAFT_417495 [Neurospora tetraspora]|uniref:Uncharacterized protein n=1 Tax=Neurospora tetraspora TaxID=94610 RepID=A0AAE0JPR6_9PEZI|nr:hypothetical protein B0H65DRAFT_417495 [Neurospora tetraspora]
MPLLPIHRASTAVRMKAAAPRMKLSVKLSAQNITTLNKSRFNTIPDIKTRRDRLSQQQDGLLPRLHHLDTSSLSTTRLHPAFLFLSAMSAIDPVASTSAITSSSALDKHQLLQLSSIPGTDDIWSKGMKTSKAMPPFTVVMLRYQALSARSRKVRTEGKLPELVKDDSDSANDNGNGTGKGDGNEEDAKENMEEDNKEKED